MLARKIALNAILSAATRVFGTLLALVTIGLITRYLTKTEWGEYSIVLTFGAIFSVLADGGLYQLLVRDISREGADEKKIASNIFSLRLLSSLFVFLLAPAVSFAFPYSAQTRWAILIGSLGFWFLSGAQILMGIFQKHLRMDKVAVAEIAGRVVQLGLVAVFIWLKLGLLWIMGALFLSSLVNFLLIFWLVQGHGRVGWRVDFVFWKESIRQSYPLAISGILTMIYFSSDSLFLSVVKPATDVGIYRLSYKILESLIFFPAMFVGLIMPLLSRAAFIDWPRFRMVFQKGMDVLFVLATPIVFGTFVLSAQIIGLLGGGNYPESIRVLNILIVAVGIIFFGTLFSYALIALRKQKSLLWIAGTGAVFNVIANLALIPRYSYLAAATTTVLTEALVVTLMLFVLRRAVSLRPSFWVGAKSLLAAVMMAGVLWQLRQANFFLLLVIAGVVYCALLYLLRGLSVKEISALFKKEA